jgi:uncharacterized protein YkwD
MYWFWAWLIIAGIILLLLIRNNKARKQVYRSVRLLHNRFASLKERRGSRQLKVVNEYRRKHGLRPLKVYYELDRIARGHSHYMAKHRSCNHAGFPHRAADARRVTGSGYVSENCFRYPARVYNTHVARRLVQGWMKSPGHRANLMNPRYTKIGIGIVTKGGYVYATQIFTG